MTHQKPPFDAGRRRLLSGLATAGAGAAVLSACGSDPSVSAEPPLPAPKDLPIDSFVVVMMENRSFDHYLGWVPGADGIQAGLRFVDRNGQLHETYPLGPQRYDGCGVFDPDHGYEGGRTHFNGGLLDGFLRTVPEAADIFPIGYYGADDLPFYRAVAEHYTVCDRYFSGILASTYPNRMYMHTGQTDRASNNFTISQLPTVWDRLRAKGLRGHYYFSDIPFTALFGTRHLDLTRPVAQFYLDAALGTLPELSFVEPRFLGEGQGVSNDDHAAGADIRNGQNFLTSVYEALRTSPQWSRTAMILVYDEWGGFFDHAVPPVYPVSEAEAALPNDGRLGFRVPCVVLSPYARRGQVYKGELEPNAVLDAIRYRFELDPLSVRSDRGGNILRAFDFAVAPNLDPPKFPDVPIVPTLCREEVPLVGGLLQALPTVSGASRRADEFEDMRQLKQLARKFGFAV